jgi:hypothetical protein
MAAFVLLSVLCCPLSVCFAQAISSTELINNAKQYDGKVVTYEGEVIADVMVRGDYAWANINDGKNAVGVWLNRDLTQAISYVGNYKSKGDWVEVVGVFARACPQHGGDLDIHGQSLRVIAAGRQTAEKINFGKRNFALVLLGALCITWTLSLFVKK